MNHTEEQEDVVMEDVLAPTTEDAQLPPTAVASLKPLSDPLLHPLSSLEDAEIANVSSTTWIDSLLPVPSLDPPTDIRSNAFAQFVQGWESYMNDDGMMDPFQEPLQILQGLSLCGHPTLALPPIKAMDPLMIQHPPSTLRYTYSSPTQITRKASGFDEPFPPPPVALDPFQRSSSTPSAFRQHSTSFGTRDGSAFTPRCTGFVPVGRESSSLLSTFGPVDFYSMALEDMERTSIEVQDISGDVPGELAKDKLPTKRGPASRAAQFLQDVRVLRRRRQRRNRGGRENPVDFQKDEVAMETVDRPMDTAVTVLTETIFNVDTSFLSTGGSELSAPNEDGATDVEDGLSDREEKESQAGDQQQYHQFDSDMEEEVARYQRIEAQMPSSSTSFDLPTEDATMHIQVSDKPRFAMAMEVIAAASPTLEETPWTLSSSNGSPHTTSGSSSGHTTQATLPSQSTGLQSGLSTISETDREVMEANKDAKRRRGLDSLVTKFKMGEQDGSMSSSSNSSNNPHQYFSLASSPLRDGAVVPVTPMLRAHTTSTSTGNRSESTTSPTTTNSLPVTHASSTSSGEEPPTFVSYIDREASPDFYRETTSSQRAAEGEAREASPASQMMAYADLGDDLTAPSQLRGSRLDRWRRPPRPKGKTPPPIASPVLVPAPPPLSPPRNMVDLLPEAGISRPHVLRSQFSDPLAGGGGGEGRIWNPDDPIVKRRTYQERSIEVLTAAADELVKPNFVTPEKEVQ
jgi:hypothetical protein